MYNQIWYFDWELTDNTQGSRVPGSYIFKAIHLGHGSSGTSTSAWARASRGRNSILGRICMYIYIFVYIYIYIYYADTRFIFQWRIFPQKSCKTAISIITWLSNSPSYHISFWLKVHVPWISIHHIEIVTFHGYQFSRPEGPTRRSLHRLSPFASAEQGLANARESSCRELEKLGENCSLPCPTGVYMVSIWIICG